ncbi:MAG: Uma2 family endonuclease [Planctomycetota bacterium]|nr:MAG: Uma2 family endonuclease [Planctomycetota bacterium]REJ93607.1 MAG: Uma2 family endonuclease [Planctomycetota bacterium]REK19933.1 MAG: Uma2 family endonuclease [Planctomycetota bacterium]REK27498.1 MAG: Uma2 family endonuclease [Planctomycetota bacterium]
MATATLMTADQYARMEDRGVPTELVRGDVLELSWTTPRHGQICGNASRAIVTFAEQHELGHTVIDAGILTERDPDTVRGGDVWFISYSNVPNGPLPQKYLDVPPDIVIEVRSDHDGWAKVIEKVAEYLNAGVPVDVVLDPETETARVHYADAPEVILNADDELTFPDQLPGFSIRVGRLFE